MRITLCTIGFAGKSAEEFFRLLREAGVKRVVDIRENRGGQLSGFAKFPDVAFFLERVGGIAYAHEPLFAPTKEIRIATRKGRDWATYKPAFLALMRERGVPEQISPDSYAGAVALLCSEPAPEQCHRRLVADLLADSWRASGHEVQIQHLVIEKPGQAKKRKKKAAGSDDRTDPE